MPFGTSVSIAYTSDGRVAERLGCGSGFAAWISSWTLFWGEDDIASVGMVESRADSAALLAPPGASARRAFSAADCAALRDCLVPNASVRAVLCDQLLVCISDMLVNPTSSCKHG
jgi:hypothetical protein